MATLRDLGVLLVTAFGPAGAVSLVLVGVVGYVYRRDVLRKNGASRDAFDKILPAFVENAKAAEKLASAIDELRQQQQRSEDEFLRRVEHAINAGFHTVVLELRSQGR